MHATAGTSQTIDIVNTAGTGAGAITLTSTAGGVDINAGAGVTIDAAGASNLTTTSGALTLQGAGGVDIAASGVTTTINGDLNVNGDTTTFSSANTTDPQVIIKNTTNDATGALLKFVKDKGAAGAANDVNGLIQFVGDDANQDQVTFSEIKSQVKVATDGQEGGKFTISVAEHDGTQTAGLVIEDGDADGELDVTIGAGSNSTVTIPGTINVNSIVLGTGGGSATNTVYGNSALASLNGATKVTAVGYESLNANTSGSNNTAIGHQTLANNSNAGQSTAVGDSSSKGIKC